MSMTDNKRKGRPIQEVMYNKSTVSTPITATAFWLLLLGEMMFWIEIKISPPYGNIKLL